VTSQHIDPEDLNWRCSKCGEKLVAAPAVVEYMGNRFDTDLPQCPKCGWVLVTEKVAKGKMGEVERILEDK
jgi:NAD-dependent SIR2 family protein deacetylase